MSDEINTNTKLSWTWADQLSTYRFWGILLFYILSSGGFSLVQYILIPLIRRGGSSDAILQFFPAQGIGAMLGLYAAWLVIRGRTIFLLILLALLGLVGVVMIYLSGEKRLLITIGSALTGITSGALMMAVPAIVAGGRGNAQAIVVSFSVLFTVYHLCLMAMNSISGIIFSCSSENPSHGAMIGMIVIAASIVIGVLFLLPVSRELFNSPPPPRGYSFTPAIQRPRTVGYLSCIPFYCLFWLYRAHGEVASLAPSREIFSPRGAVAGAFIPWFLPIIMTTLIDVLNRRAMEQGKPPLRASWTIFFWSFFALPVGIALLQSAINRMIESEGSGEKI